MKVKSLPIVFTGNGEVKGFLYTQIECADKAFLYEVNTGDSIYYEVFKKYVNRRFACESYPSSRLFGISAWTYYDLNQAKEKFNELSKKK